jgi:hypothetical protein
VRSAILPVDLEKETAMALTMTRPAAIDTRGHDPLITVFGAEGATYSCPDLQSVDAHLARLCDRLGYATPRFPALITLFRSEIDRLLDRRRWLELDAMVVDTL